MLACLGGSSSYSISSPASVTVRFAEFPPTVQTLRNGVFPDVTLLPMHSISAERRPETLKTESLRSSSGLKQLRFHHGVFEAATSRRKSRKRTLRSGRHVSWASRSRSKQQFTKWGNTPLQGSEPFRRVPRNNPANADLLGWANANREHNFPVDNPVEVNFPVRCMRPHLAIELRNEENLSTKSMAISTVSASRASAPSPSQLASLASSSSE